jgi:hypothetical protein
MLASNNSFAWRNPGQSGSSLKVDRVERLIFEMMNRDRARALARPQPQMDGGL